jgi:hypothetical protein
MDYLPEDSLEITLATPLFIEHVYEDSLHFSQQRTTKIQLLRSGRAIYMLPFQLTFAYSSQAVSSFHGY